MYTVLYLLSVLIFDQGTWFNDITIAIIKIALCENKDN